MKKNYRNFTAGELSEDMYSRYDVDKYGTGCMKVQNFLLMEEGGVLKRPGTRYIAPAGDSDHRVRLVEFEFSTEQAYCLELGHHYMRVYKDRGQVLEAEQSISGITQASPCVISAPSHGYADGAEVYVSDVEGMWEVNGRSFIVRNPTTGSFEIEDLQGNAVDASQFTAYVSGGSVAAIYEIETPFIEGDIFAVKYSQSADVLTLVHGNHDPRELTRTGHTSWSLTTISFAPNMDAPTEIGAVALIGSGSTEYKYKVTAVKEETLEESLPSAEGVVSNDLSTSGNENEVSWAAVPGAVRYNIYKNKSGTFGFVGASESLSFVDDNIDPDVSITPPRARNPFSGENQKPSTVAFHRQRRIFGATKERPDGLDMSRAGMYSNMSQSIPQQADDAISFALASGRVNKINDLIPFRNLLAMTKDQEWQITSEGSYKATTIEADPETDYGSDSLSPIMIGNTAIFTAKYGRTVRDYSYSFSADGYDGNDLTVLSKHLLKAHGISDWDYAQEPDRNVWAARADGVGLSLKYVREHTIRGWCRHVTDGEIESVCVVPNEAQRRDDVYFVVRRLVNGSYVRFIEVLEEYIDDPIEDAFFVDCGASYDGSPITEVRGLWHLEGVEAVIYADGNVVPRQVVSGGKIELAIPASKVVIGRYYESHLQPLPAEGDSERGTTKGAPKRIKNIQAEVVRSRGLLAGQSDEDGYFGEMRPAFDGLDLSGSIKTFTGIVDFLVEGSWDDVGVAPFVKSDLPVPAKILSLNPTYE